MNIPRRILVVDDEPLVTTSCRRVLTDAGYDVDTTESGREGMNRALGERFDLVVTDLKMPDLDGMQLVRALKRERPDTAIVVITGYGTVPSAIEATKLGASDYIEKPFTPDQLVEATSQAMAFPDKEHTPRIEAESVREALRLASRDPRLGASLLEKGSCVLSGYPLSAEAKAAITSGDIAWIEKTCGDLSDEERDWLTRRLEVEAW